MVIAAWLSDMAPVSSIAAGIRIGNAQRGQDIAFQPLHALGLSVGPVIVPQKMQKAMDREMGKVLGSPA